MDGITRLIAGIERECAGIDGKAGIYGYVEDEWYDFADMA
jgi:hypothetical protein